MKLRLNREVHERAVYFAGCVGESLTAWMGIAARCRRKGRLDDVAVPAELLSATRGDVVVSYSGEREDPAWLRECVALAVLHCEARHKPFKTDLVEGRDYVLGREF